MGPLRPSERREKSAGEIRSTILVASLYSDVLYFRYRPHVRLRPACAPGFFMPDARAASILKNEPEPNFSIKSNTSLDPAFHAGGWALLF
jgi:hypothetical protein